MKCPKCAYVGFEESDRCRHCGYDFSLIAEPAAGVPAAPLRAVETPRHTSYREPARAASDADLSRDDAAPLVDLPLATPALTAPPVPFASAASAAPAVPPALPPSLFADPQPPPARAPLAVRRTADRPRSRATPHVVRRPRPELLEPAITDAAQDAPPPASAVAAPPVTRILSLVIDVAVLSGIDAAVVYLTAQIASVPMGQVLTLPLVPLAAFIVGLNVAYLAVFTANGGQTLGKMATGLRVEATDGALTFGGAVVRVAAAIAGGLVAGAGFLPALFRADRRAVHDQIAHTRVVKVSA